MERIRLLRLWDYKLIIFTFKDTFLCATTQEQSERLKTQVKTFLKANGFWWDREDFCWKLFGLYIEDNLIEQAKYLDEVTGSTRRLLQFKRGLEKREWVQRFDVKLDDTCFKSPPLPNNRRLQLRAINNMISHEGFIANLGLGSGKTYTSVTAFNHLEKAGIVDKMLVVTLGSVLFNWKKEILKFTWIKEEEIFIMDSKKNRNPWINSDKYKVILCTYDGFKVLIDDIYKKNKTSFKARKFERKYCFFKEFQEWSENFMYIIDEAHFINNKSSKNNNYVTALSLIATQITELTGSLFRKFRNEIYFHMNLICPDIVGNCFMKPENYERFLNVTAEVTSPHSTTIVKTIDEKMDYLDKIFYRYIMKGKVKLEVSTEYVKVNVKLSDKHMSFYKNVSKWIMQGNKKEEEGFTSNQIVNAFPNYSMALADPMMLKGKFPEQLKDFEWSLEENEKFQIAKEIIEKHRDDKAIIWLRNPMVLDMLEEALQDYKPLKYHGKVKPPKGMTKHEHKQLVVDKFNEEEEYRILLCNPSSLGTGQNILAGNINIFFNIPHNIVDDYLQSLGRSARPGQTKDIIYYLLVASNTIDEMAYHTLTHRSYLNDLKAKYKFFTREQIRDLLLGKIIE